MEQTLVFDVNETTLDSGALDPLFAEAFGDSSARRTWFHLLLELSQVATITNTYRPFPELGEIALDMHARRTGRSTIEQRQAILQRFAALPVHPDVPSGLHDLHRGGKRLVALTNSPAAAARRALEGAGVERFFQRVLSADDVRAFKPHSSVYEHAQAALGAQPSELCLVSAHWWDCLGASRCGWKSVFVARPGQIYDSRLVPSLYQVSDFIDLAQVMGSSAA